MRHLALLCINRVNRAANSRSDDNTIKIVFGIIISIISIITVQIGAVKKPLKHVFRSALCRLP